MMLIYVGCGSQAPRCTACASADTSNTSHASADDADGLSGLPWSLEVTSETFASGDHIPELMVFNGFGCAGENQSPQLSWSAGPAETKSYAVMMYDLDAPTGVGFHHWMVANIPADVHQLPMGAGSEVGLPEGAVASYNDFGTTQFGGPCPPEGRTHRYEMYVWALGVEQLPANEQTTGALFRFLIRGNTLAAGRITATYHR